MRLSLFITENTEAILVQFEEFARTHTAAGDTMDMAALRDHAAAMLGAIALDISKDQNDADQERKSKGDAPPTKDAPPTAAEKHGTDRAARGFSLEEMFAEYRALRASVLRLWTTRWTRALDEQDAEDLVRFNEAIDQALAESITQFSEGLDTSREMFLAIIGHDLRTPLGAVLTASKFLVSEGALEGSNLTMASRIQSSGQRMRKLVGDLLDFTSARLGRGIPIERADGDIAEIARESVAEISGQFPTRQFQLTTSGDTSGSWDAPRIAQVLSNLVGNAVQHGAEGTGIRVDVNGSDREILVSIHNEGAPIRLDDIGQIFDPFKRSPSPHALPEVDGSMGLGLYIAQQVAQAHRGWIDVSSSDADGTTFLLHLPRLD